MNLRFVTLLAGWLALGVWAAAAEPSIEDMLREVEAKARRPAPAGPGVGDPATESEYLRNMKARLQYESTSAPGASPPRTIWPAWATCSRPPSVGTGAGLLDTPAQKLPSDWRSARAACTRACARSYTVLGQPEQATPGQRGGDPAQPRALDEPRLGPAQGLASRTTRTGARSPRSSPAKGRRRPQRRGVPLAQLVLYRYDVPCRDEFVGPDPVPRHVPQGPRVAVSATATGA